MELALATRQLPHLRCNPRPQLSWPRQLPMGSCLGVSSPVARVKSCIMHSVHVREQYSRPSH